ncbi:hypothetical protein FWP33_16975 [Vibrio parahaemolyticus]|jgi:divalent metal cation (Fe/Co/Zn/Cd) transporter|uniref:hypothetical protein n=1 Tax=Vibrio jasicida TaxID=766224 RepID=UPI002895D205|nr:hypothetical protein [Vibrio parahaemolyticus]CAH1592967.1 hypothetical protein THF1C08_320081 [Vibrio jasicida]
MKKSKPLGAFKAAIVALFVAGVSCFIFRQILLSEHSLLKKMEMTWMPYVMALLVGWVVFLYTSQVRVVSGSNSNQNSSK